MSGLLTAIVTGVAAFIATNIDDILILMVFFAQANSRFRYRHIISGQYLGFTALIIASLPGFFGSLIVSPSGIKMLGLIPVVIGVSLLLNGESDDNLEIEDEEIKQPQPYALISFLSPQTYSVAAVTIANGSDNVGLYLPLFANSDLSQVLVIISIFFLLVGIWCYTAYKLTNLPAIAALLTKYSKSFLPCVLIGLGVFIVKESIYLTILALVATYLWLETVGKNEQEETEKLNN